MFVLRLLPKAWVCLPNDLRITVVNIGQTEMPCCQQNFDGIKINESCNFSFWRWGLRNQKAGFPGQQGWDGRCQPRAPHHHPAKCRATPPSAGPPGPGLARSQQRETCSPGQPSDAPRSTRLCPSPASLADPRFQEGVSLGSFIAQG